MKKINKKDCYKLKDKKKPVEGLLQLDSKKFPLRKVILLH